jgi:hypothetical protein
MDTITFIRQALTQVHERLMATLEDLTEADVAWRPGPAANTILEIACHVARAEDRLGRRMTGFGPELWDSQGWKGTLSSAADVRAGEPYQFLGRHGAVPPRLADVKEYLLALHRDTLEKLGALTPAALDGVPDPGRPERTIATYFRHMITHKNNHHGQIDLIRGLMHPEWNLAPGTGIVQR